MLIKRSEIPTYLHKSAFYQALDEEEDGEIDVPDLTMKLDCTINSTKDLEQLLSTLRFWMVDEIPVTLLDYLCDAKSDEYHKVCVLDRYGSQLPYLVQMEMLAKKTSVKKIFKMILANGWLQLLQYFQRKYKITWTLGMAAVAVENGQLECLRIAHEQGSPLDAQLCILAAKHKHLHCLQYLHEQGCAWSRHVCKFAAANGDLAMLTYAHQQGCKWNAEVYLAAAQGGHLQCLKYANEQGLVMSDNPHYAHGPCTAAASHGHLDCLAYLRELDFSWDAETMSGAARGGHADCLRYTIEHGCPGTGDCCRCAVIENQPQCLELAMELGCPLTSSCFAQAANEDNLKLLKFLHEHDCPIDNLDVIANAARAGSLRCLTYAHSVMQRPLTEYAFTCAAKEGNLACLRYLHDNDCPCDATASAGAARYGQLENLRFLRDHNYPWDALTIHKYIDSYHPDERILDYAFEHGCPFGMEEVMLACANDHIAAFTAMCKAGVEFTAAVVENVVSNHNIEFLKIAHEYGMPLDNNIITTTSTADSNLNQSLCEKYASNDWLPHLQYVVEQGCAWEESLIKKAAEDGQVLVVQYLFDQLYRIASESAHVAQVESDAALITSASSPPAAVAAEAAVIVTTTTTAATTTITPVPAITTIPLTSAMRRVLSGKRVTLTSTAASNAAAAATSNYDATMAHAVQRAGELGVHPNNYNMIMNAASKGHLLVVKNLRETVSYPLNYFNAALSAACSTRAGV